MARLSVVIGTVFLASCAGVGEMRQEAPTATFTSAKTPDVVAACVSEAWTLHKILLFTPDVRINPITDGKQVMIYNPSSASPSAFADMRRVGEVTDIRYYTSTGKGRVFKSEFVDLIEPCL